MFRRTVSVMMLILLLVSMLAIAFDIHPAYASVSWDSWWVDDVMVTEAFIGDVVTGQIHIQGEVAGRYNLQIRRDIAWAYDETVVNVTFDYDGGYSTKNLTFTPLLATGESNTNGYHMDLSRNGTGVWTLENSYPPRLRVYRGMPTTLNLDVPFSEVRENETIVFTGNLTKSHTGAGISGRTISLYDFDGVSSFYFMASGTTQSGGAFSIPWIATPVDSNRDVDVYSYHGGSSIYLSSRSPSSGYYHITIQETYIIAVTSQQDDYSTADLGNLVFNGVPYSFPNSFPTASGNFSIRYESASGYVFSRWIASSGATVANQFNPSTFVTISGNGTITAMYTSKERRLTVYSDHGNPNPPIGDNYRDYGSLVSCSVDSLVKEGSMDWACTGWSGTGSVPLNGTGTSVSFIITQNSTIRWNWTGSVRQHTLNVSSAHDSPAPSNGPHTYEYGQTVTCSVTSPIIEGSMVWTCTGWSGTGSVPPNGTGTSVAFTIFGDSAITWNWQSLPMYNITIGAHCNNENTNVSVSVTLDSSTMKYTPCTFTNLYDTHNFTVSQSDTSGHTFLQWSTNQTSATITVSSGGTYTAYYWTPPPTYLRVESEFSGYLLKNVHFNNKFGVYTTHAGTLPIRVDGIIGGVNYTFSPPSSLVDSYNLTVDVDSLLPDSILPWSKYGLTVFATYSDGTVLAEYYPFLVIEPPSWLVSILNKAEALEVDGKKSGDWNNTYAVYVSKEFGLSGIFNVTIPLPKFAGGGNYTLFPSVKPVFSFYSNGTFTISTVFKLANPNPALVPMKFGVAEVKAHVTITVSGRFDVQNSTITWVSATLSLEVGAGCTVQVPIAGYTFAVPYVGDVTIGLSATVTVDADFAASIVLAPTQNASREFIPGLELMIQSITGQVSFDVGLAVNAGIGIASISGGGNVHFVMYLQAVKPYVSGGVVTGTVYIKWHALFWGGTLWSKSGTLYQWNSSGSMSLYGNFDSYIGFDDSYIDPDDSNYTVIPRYYNTTDYEGLVWVNGSWKGVALQNMYPFTRIGAASYGDNAYILYTTDNVSMSQENGISLTGFEFNSSTGTLRRLEMPLITNEIFFDPVLTSLPNGTLLAIWDSIPFSALVNANPFEINSIILQYAYFDPTTKTWSPIRNLTKTGTANSYALSSDSTGSYALVLQGDSIFSTDQYLAEYDVQSGSILLNMSAANVSSIVSFNSYSHLAILQAIDGSYAVMNLSSHGLITLPAMDGYEIESIQLAKNSADSLGILYSSPNSTIFSIYNVSSKTVYVNMNGSQSTNYLGLIVTEFGYRLITCDSQGITSSVIRNQTLASVLYPMENVTSMGATVTDHGILVYTTQNYGNSSYPLLNMTLTFIPNIVVLDATISKTTVGQEYSMNVTVTLDNEGTEAENFNVALKANATVASQTQLTLGAGSISTMTFLWNTSSFAYNNYSIGVCIGLVPAMTSTTMNDFTCSIPVHVGVPGDVSGNVTQGVYDGITNMRDIQYLILLFNTKPNSPNWNPNADINNDGTVNMRDIQIAILNFNKHE